jgi:hypothetical protein
MSPYWRCSFFLDLDRLKRAFPRAVLSALLFSTDISSGPEGAGQVSHSGRAAGSGRSRRPKRSSDATPAATFFAAEQLAVGNVRCEDFLKYAPALFYACRDACYWHKAQSDRTRICPLLLIADIGQPLRARFPKNRLAQQTGRRHTNGRRSSAATAHSGALNVRFCANSRTFRHALALVRAPDCHVGMRPSILRNLWLG